MSYRHILVAVDFDKGNQDLIKKAVQLAKPLDAKLSLIHVDDHVNESFVFGGLIDTDLAAIESEYPNAVELTNKLNAVADQIDYPIERKFLVKGEMSHALDQPVTEAGIDLIICGHHHDFWSRWKPTSRELINTAQVDLLIVPLND